MPFDGTGTFVQTNGFFTGVNIWAQDKAAGVDVVASRHDTHDQDTATGLSTCITKDGQTTPTANIPMGGFKLTGLGAGTANGDAVNVGQIQNSTSSYGGVSTGAANVYAVTLTPAITSYVAGQRVQFKAHQSNTGATTLNVNAVGVANILKNTTQGATIANDIVTGEIIDVIYDGTGWQLQNQPSAFDNNWTPAAGGSGLMTFTSVTVNYAHYYRVGTLIHVSVNFTGTVGGTPNNTLTFNLPIAPRVGGQVCACLPYNNATPVAGYLFTSATVLTSVVLLTGNYSTTVGGEGLIANFFYEAA